MLLLLFSPLRIVRLHSFLCIAACFTLDLTYELKFLVQNIIILFPTPASIYKPGQTSSSPYFPSKLRCRDRESFVVCAIRIFSKKQELQIETFHCEVLKKLSHCFSLGLFFNSRLSLFSFHLKLFLGFLFSFL